MDFFDKLCEISARHQIPEKFVAILKKCYVDFTHATHNRSFEKESLDLLFDKYLELVSKQIQNPYQFEAYHHKITEPFDYECFGLDFMRPLIIFQKSKLHGEKQLNQIKEQIQHQENVIFLANHQTEPDPQIIHLMLEEKWPELGSNMIFVAGDRVITDPMAVPFSLGRNLFCIYSKKYMETPPELKAEKQAHNQRTLKKMGEMLSQGGKSLYIAPSGGRDRPGQDGKVEVAPFDPESIELLHLLSKRSGKPTHFYPLALKTYAILPPPSSIQIELGEERKASRSPVFLAFGDELSMEQFPGSEHAEKKLRREKRAEWIWQEVVKLYQPLG